MMHRKETREAMVVVSGLARLTVVAVLFVSQFAHAYFGQALLNHCADEYAPVLIIGGMSLSVLSAIFVPAMVRGTFYSGLCGAGFYAIVKGADALIDLMRRL